MLIFHPSINHKLTGIAASLALILTTPQTLLAGGNTALGDYALSSNSGNNNSAFGSVVLCANTSGSSNTAAGAFALYSNTVGSENTANGSSVLADNTYGGGNTASGDDALRLNISGFINTATGANTLVENTTGSSNTACGWSALRGNNGDENTANGVGALEFNSTGYANTASGRSALISNDSGWGNTAIGYQTLYNLTYGHNNVAVGFKAGYELKGSNNVAIGNTGDAGDNNTTRIGGGQNRAFIAGISGIRSSGGVAVYINSAGQLGTLTSSERFKQDIHSIDTVSDKLLQLRPVSFTYKADEKKELQYGLIAEEVAKVYPDLVQYDQDGKPFTVYYQLLTPLLLSELQKEHALDNAQQVTLTARQEKLDAQQAELAHLTQELTAQQAEMNAIAQRQQQQQQKHVANMIALKEKLNQLDQLVQTSGSSPLSSTNVALVPSH